MIYCKYEIAFAEDVELPEGEEIFEKCLHLNASKTGKNCIFIKNIPHKNCITGACIAQDFETADGLIKAFVEALGLGKGSVTSEETTFRSVSYMLKRASERCFGEDSEAAFRRIGVDLLDDRYKGFDFYENILPDYTANELVSRARACSVCETFLPELDRIFLGKNPKYRRAHGHPVHYMIETDDEERRAELCRILSGALYLNGRLSSKRVATVDVDFGANFREEAYRQLCQSAAGCAVAVNCFPSEEEENDLAASCRGTIETLSNVLTDHHNDVLTIFCFPRKCERIKTLFREYLGDTAFVEIRDDSFDRDAVTAYFKDLARKNGVRTDKKLLASVDPDRTYLSNELNVIFENWYAGKLKSAVYPQYEKLIRKSCEKPVFRSANPAQDELEKMIGLADAKKVIFDAVRCFKAQVIFAEKGLPSSRPSMHMLFTGNPGTAKTTVARLFGQIMRENGLLSSGNFIEVGRADLVGKYVGWTANIIQKKFTEAEGGVLFIDEAYSLVDDRDGSYGDEAINTIVREMENYRSDTVVIFAGYPDKMERFLDKNPGLRSRIAFHVPFDDYAPDELLGIADLMIAKKGLKLSPGARDKLSEIFAKAIREKDFGNGRYVRNVIEKAEMLHGSRLLDADPDTLCRSDVLTILPEDVEMPVFKSERAPKIGFAAG